MKLVTVATGTEGYMKWLLESSRRHNASIIVLGYGEKWQGYSWKFLKMKDFLSKLDPKEIVCFVDAYDVVILKDLRQMESEFKRISKMSNKGIVASLDIPPFYSKYVSRLTFGTCHNTAINSGGYIGYAKDLLEMISYVKDATDDDQVVLTEYCKNSNNVLIDTDNTFFLSIGRLYSVLRDKNIKIENTRLYYKNKQPYILHAFGNTYIDNTIKNLGYTLTPEDEKTIDEYHTRAMKRKIVYYTHILLWRIVCLAILVVSIYLLITNIYPKER